MTKNKVEFKYSYLVDLKVDTEFDCDTASEIKTAIRLLNKRVLSATKSFENAIVLRKTKLEKLKAEQQNNK